MVTDYTVCVRASDPAHQAFLSDVPEYVRVVDVSRWAAVPSDIRAINPAHYPAIINHVTDQVIERPASWAAGMAAMQSTPTVPARVSPRQFRLALFRLHGATDAVIEAAINEHIPEPMRTEALIEYRTSTYFRSDHPLLKQLAPLFELSRDDLDQLFIAAGAIE